MSITVDKPHTTDRWLYLSKSLTQLVNRYWLGPEQDLIVYCFDHTEDNWEKQAAAWHRPATGDIVINLGYMFREIQPFLEKQAKKERGSFERFEGHIRGVKSNMYAPNDALIVEMQDILNTSLSSRRGDYFTPKKGTPLTDQSSMLYGILSRGLRSIRETYAMKDKVAYKLLSHIIGVIIHETGHAVFSRYILEDWWSKEVTPYQRQILTMFDELRCESMQSIRVGKPSISTLRGAASLVVNPTQIAEDLEASREDGSVEIATVALTSTLVLGRSTYGVFRKDEVTKLSNSIEILVGEDRFKKMFEIWEDYLKIKSLTKTNAVRIAKRWEELFPEPENMKTSIAIVVIKGDDGEMGNEEDQKDESPGGGSKSSEEKSEDSTDDDKGENKPGDDGDDTESYSMGELDSIDTKDVHGSGSHKNDAEKISLPGIVDDLGESVKEAVESAVETPNEKDMKPGACQDIQTSYQQAKKKKLSTTTPDSEDYVMSKKFTEALQTIYLVGRDKFQVATQLPPGRLRSRSAVQNAAYRRAGSSRRQEQWERTRLTTNINPKLTVGIMTDCSGSQGWAETFSSKVSWILSRSFREISARTASVAFGGEVYITSKPGESLQKRVFVSADEMAEKFDVGLGTLDYMLKLSSGAGARILFVVSDGHFVINGERARAVTWLKQLHQNDCKVIWIGPRQYHDKPWMTDVPGVAYLEVDRYAVDEKPSDIVKELINIVKNTLDAEKQAMIKRR